MSPPVQASFRALADPTRREILRQLSTRELSIAEVVDHFALTRTAVRKHLQILEEGDLITLTQRGRERVTSLNPTGIQSVAQWLSYFDRYWDKALVGLKATVEINNKHNKAGKS